MTLFSRIVDFLGLRRSIVGLLAMAILVGMGEKMGERFLPIYLIALGSGTLWPGFLNALDNLLSALYSFPGGWLADRLGIKRSLLLFNLLAMVGFLLVILIPRWEAVILGSFLFLSWTAISLPATMSLLGRSLPKEKHVMGVSVHSLVRRIPMALGPIVGGFFIDTWGSILGVRLAFIAALLMALVALVLQQCWIEEDRGTVQDSSSPRGFLRILQTMRPELRNLLLADILIRFCEQIPYAYVVLWCMSAVPGIATARVSGAEFGLLTAIEMVTAMLCYLPVAWFADRGGKKPYVLATFVNFTLFPLLLFYCRSFGPLVLAFIARGLKEFGEPTRKALIYELAEEGQKASAFGAYYLCRDVVVSIGAFVGAFLWNMGPAVNFFTAFGCGVAGTLWFAVAGKDLSRPVQGEANLPLPPSH